MGDPMIGGSFWLDLLLQGRGGGDLPGLGGGFLFLFALFVLAVNIWATIRVVQGRLSLLAKVLWLLAIWLFFPPVGAILYALLGRTR